MIDIVVDTEALQNGRVASLVSGQVFITEESLKGD